MPDRRLFLQQFAAAVAASATTPFAAFAASPTLQDLAATRGILYGSAVAFNHLSEPAYAQLYVDQCSIIVAENAMKWARTQPELGRYDFEQADAIVAFGEKNKMKIRGHNLCWHESQPAWLEQTVNKENAAKILTDHIHTVAGRYAGKIHSWDVVNEAIEVKDGRPDGLRDSNWLQWLGEAYIPLAFHAAAEADPHAILTYNDYGLEGDGDWSDKRRAVALALLQGLLKIKAPVQALGLQSHLNPHADRGTDYSAFNRFITEVHNLGLQVFVTELDVETRDLATDPEKLNKQVAQAYANYLENVLKHPFVNVILTWGMTTHGHNTAGHKHYEDTEHVLPFNADLTPGPAFAAMERALKKR